MVIFSILLLLSFGLALDNWLSSMFVPSLSRVLIDDGTPRMPFPLRIHLSLTVFRLKQMIEAQEGFTVGEQEVFFHGNPVGSLFSGIF